jgi:uncharacterized lipoprotein YajG
VTLGGDKVVLGAHRERMTKRLLVATAAFLMIAAPAHAATSSAHVDPVPVSRVTHVVTNVVPTRSALTH